MRARPSRTGLACITTLTLGVGLLVAGPVSATVRTDDPVADAAAVAGALTSGDSLFPHQGNGGYDALHYDVDLSVDVAISATANAVAQTTLPAARTSMRAQTTGAPLSSFAMDFEGPGLTVSAVSVDGVAAAFTREEVLTPDNATTDVHKLVVTPTTPVSGVFTTVVTYSGRPNAHTDADGSSEGWNNTRDGATVVNEPVGAMTAYPHNDTPADKATYTFSLDVPTRLSTSATLNPGRRAAAAVANGELLSRTPSGDGTRTTWVWDQRNQMASDLALISVGRYDMYTSDITLASGRTIPEWSFLDPSMTATNTTSTTTVRSQLASYLDFFESRYGPYPGNSTGVVVDIVPGGINYALETQDRSFFPTRVSSGTAIHETMHQWFGDSVSPRDWNDIWLNEGPATYAETQYVNEGSGTSQTTTETENYDLWSDTDATSDDWKIAPAAMTEASQLFGWQVYDRGSMTLEALRGSIGDAAFRTVMRRWQLRFAGTSRRTSKFIALAERVSGRDLRAFFQDWLYDVDKPSWVQRYTPQLVAPADAAPGETVPLTLKAVNVGKIALSSSIATVDLSDVLDDSTLDTAALPAGVTLRGPTLTWAIPSTEVATTSKVTVPVVIDADAVDARLVATIDSATLGGVCLRGCKVTTAVTAPPVSPSPKPTLAGTSQVGRTLRAVPGAWDAAATLSYQWLRDGAPVARATGKRYRLVPDDAHSQMAVTVTGTRPGHEQASSTSEAVAVKLGRQTRKPSPRIKGRPRVGEQLVALAGPRDAGARVSYRWIVGGTAVKARGKTLAVRKAYVGARVRVRVTSRKAGYRALRGASPKVGPVR